MALTGFYAPGPEVSAATQTQTVPTSEPRDFVLDVARCTSADELPQPLALTRVSAGEERLIATTDMTRVRQLLRSSIRPVIWADGPLKFAALCLALTSRSTNENTIPGGYGSITGKRAQEAWAWAVQTVRELPPGITSRDTGRPRTQWGVTRNTTQKEYIHPLTDGTLTRFYEAKFRESRNMLAKTWSDQLHGLSALDQELVPLSTRFNALSTVQALMGNVSTYPGAYDRNPRFTDLRRDAGDERADLIAMLAALLLELQSNARKQNWSTLPSDLHRVFNHFSGGDISRVFFINRLLREVTGSNWTDPDRDTLLRLATGVTAHLSFTTIDVLCHAPSTCDLNAGPLTANNFNELLSKPTVRWDDGTEFYIYEGIELNPSVIKEAINKPSSLLSVRNVEQRRVLLRVIGTDALLQDVQAEKVHEDDFGELFKLPNGSQFVIVNNATPEADGTTRKYVLGTVGTNHTTARSGVASTWGLTAANYWPAKET